MLVALAISAILLAAVGVAFNASIVNFRANEDLFKTINSARQALYRITSQLRTGYAVEPTDPNNRCSFLTSDIPPQDITYEYRVADHKLYLITNSDGHEYVLCSNVTAASFVKTPTALGTDCKSVQISLTVQTGSTVKTLAAAAVIRRNIDL